MESNTTTKQYEIPVEHLPALRKRLDSIARRAAKLGVGSVDYTVGDIFMVPFTRSATDHWVRFNGEEATLKNLIAMTPGAVSYRQFCIVTLDAETPALAGWEFCATLDHLHVDGDDVNLLRVVPGLDQNLPEKFRTATAANCDHCHKNISTRVNTFVVRNAETGEWQQVGRSCLCDFLGGHDPHAAARMLQYLLDADSACDEESGLGGSTRIESAWPITHFLAVVACVVRTEGWVSRGKARIDETLVATADLVLNLLTPPSPRASEADKIAWRNAVAKYAPDAYDTDVATRSLDYTREVLSERQDRSDYEHNLFVAASLPAVLYKTAGITASLIPYFLKEVERQTIRETEARLISASQHFGEVGTRMDFYGKLLNVFTIDGMYGTTYLHKILTREGNLVVWFGSSNPGMQRGREYLMTAAVKRHDTRDGIAQTIMTRLTVWTDQGRYQAEIKAAKKAIREAKRAKADVATLVGLTQVVQEAEQHLADAIKVAEADRAE